MPPPRPRGVGTNAGVSSSRPNLNTPMSERQQMALLIQMTSTAECSKSTNSKKIEQKKVEDVDEIAFNDKHEIQDIFVEKTMSIEFPPDSKQELSTKRTVLSPEHGGNISDGSQLIKKNFSDLDNEEDVDFEEERKKKRKDSENKDNKSTSCTRVPVRSEKSSKQLLTGNKSFPNITKQASITGEKECLCESPKNIVTKIYETDFETDEFRISENLYSGGLKVPPLKIVIPSQNCSIDIEGNVSRNGKAITSRNAALPYVVTTTNEANERDHSSQCNSPNESPMKNLNIIEEKIKLTNEDKSLHRVLRSSHRNSASILERTSNNSSPQLQSNSPSPASSTTNENTENKTSLFPTANSPILHHQAYENENSANLPSPSTSSTSSSKEIHSTVVDLHPRKRKIRIKQDEAHIKLTSNAHTDNSITSETHPHDFPFTNCFQMYLNIRKQIEKKHKLLYYVKPRPPQGYGDYLIKKRSYVLNTNNSTLSYEVPTTVSIQMRDIFMEQQKERLELSLRHTVEKEKLGLNVEQEILRVHTKAARSISCQPVPFSVCTLIRDEEIYNMITPEQEEKDRNARYRFNGRLLLSWLQDVDDKWEKVKDAMLLRHHNEAESLHAVQLMNWEIALKQREQCEYNNSTKIEELHVPMVHVNDDFDLLPE